MIVHTSGEVIVAAPRQLGGQYVLAGSAAALVGGPPPAGARIGPVRARPNAVATVHTRDLDDRFAVGVHYSKAPLPDEVACIPQTWVERLDGCRGIGQLAVEVGTLGHVETHPAADGQGAQAGSDPRSGQSRPVGEVAHVEARLKGQEGV